MNTAFTKGVVLELESNIKVVVLDSYAIDENIELELDEVYDSIADYKISKDSSRK